MTLKPNLAYHILVKKLFKKFETVFFFKNGNRKYEYKQRRFFYVRLRQQILSLSSADLRQQNKLFKNYCNLPCQTMATPLQP